ncbi:hypothetical protein [Streptococcus suis]|uniref:hypothetical protein n=1 Tax=Streptococcus suis TaxID=1307 RepID=UPI000CF46453|nr:hypothetical protein [Streptococcus suis]MCK4044856.1 hypothetical protein [Streptococcus suis]
MKKLSKPMLKELYDTYGINYDNLAKKIDVKNRIRTQANRTFKKQFDSRNWDSLTLNEQNYFLLHCMKDYMMKEIEEVIHPSSPSKIKKIKNSVETLIKEQYVSVNEYIKQANVDIGKLYTIDENGYSQYGKLQDELVEIYKSSDNNFEPESTSDDIRFSILETKINVLLKIVQEKLNVQIDIEAIEDCCKYLIKNDFNNDDIIQLEIDEQSSVPLEVQKKIIQTNQKYFAHLMQKENLEFYKDKE